MPPAAHGGGGPEAILPPPPPASITTCHVAYQTGTVHTLQPGRELFAILYRSSTTTWGRCTASWRSATTTIQFCHEIVVLVLQIA